jgi:acetyl esterase/lipase
MQVLGTAVAMRGGRWRTREGQVRLISQALSAVGLLTLERAARDSATVLEDALEAGLGADYAGPALREGVQPPSGPAVNQANPLPAFISRAAYLRAEGIQYGPGGPRNRLDIWAAQGLDRGGRAPVLVQIHGGGWTIGNTRHQAYPLMSRLAQAGWVCVPISYRLSPKATFPDHIVDVKRAVAWVKENISEYGGDPDFVVLTGGSAGGHLCALAALSAGDHAFQPGFEEADTSVQAAVPLYGIYDLRDWDGRGGPAYQLRFVEKTLLKVSPAGDPELWRRASPISWVGPGAPPMMVVHGTNDSLVPVDGARRMADALRRVSAQPVVYAELPFAQHAFDIYGSVRTRYTVRAIERFLAYVRAEYLAERRPGAGAAASVSRGDEFRAR